jgi:hypothetical protein
MHWALPPFPHASSRHGALWSAGITSALCFTTQSNNEVSSINLSLPKWISQNLNGVAQIIKLLQADTINKKNSKSTTQTHWWPGKCSWYSKSLQAGRSGGEGTLTTRPNLAPRLKKQVESYLYFPSAPSWYVTEKKSLLLLLRTHS